MFEVLLYLGDTIHNDENVVCIQYVFHDITKMFKYLTDTSNKMKDQEKYCSYVIKEIKLEKEIANEQKDI